MNDAAILKFRGVNKKGVVCFSFYYHMYGYDVNTLELYNNGIRLWSMKGDQGNTWKKAQVTIRENYSLEIKGLAGISYQGDIAIDDIAVSDGSCGGVPPSPTAPPTPPQPTTTTPAPPTTPSECKDSYGDWCKNLENDADYCKYNADWTKKNCAKSCGWCSSPSSTAPPTPPKPPQPTTSTPAPPITPSDCKDSYGDWCKNLVNDADYCKYHADWTKKNCAKSCGWCSVPSKAPPTNKPPTPPVTTAAPTKSDPSCDFERDLCSWKQDPSHDNFDWTRNTGNTPSSGTGPSSGHNGKGYYIYIEASGRVEDDVATLTFNGPNSKPVVCLSFYYHMYGNSINELYLYHRGRTVWKMSGNQGNEWKKAQVSITGDYQLVFIASVGSSYQGDIAIDDISVSDGYCVIVLPTPSLPPSPPIPTQGPSISPGNCGSRPATRIVGGQEAPINGWPWQAMLRYKGGDQFCGGTLVDPLWVVTAAHCVNRKSPSGIIIRMGAHYIRDRYGSVGTEQDIDVVQIINHESYHRPIRASNDIALLKLAKPAQLGKGVGLACLPDSNLQLPLDNMNSKCWVTGWGTVSSGGAQPKALRQASVPLVSKQRCLKGYPGKIHDSMLCAGLDQGGVDACQGDSGGPLVCEFNGRWYLEGATSWGYGCARPMQYGVYANVRYLRTWIDMKMNGGVLPPTTIAPPQPTTSVLPLSCGKSPVSRVIGGVDATPGNWPWQIALLRGSSKSFSCGGSLIAPDWIVTAAHCISRGQPGSYYTIRLGDHNRNLNEGTEQDIPGKRVIMHPNYNKIPIDSDIALIQLSRPATLNTRVQTVCLPSQDEHVPVTSRCFITGWGKIKHPGSSHTILQQANLPPVTNSECARKLAETGSGYLKITENMICGGVSGSILSGCHGDSGGPYVCQNPAGNWVLQGAVSWGSSSCNALEKYTAFARVGKFRHWIDQNMRT